MRVAGVKGSCQRFAGIFTTVIYNVAKSRPMQGSFLPASITSLVLIRHLNSHLKSQIINIQGQAYLFIKGKGSPGFQPHQETHLQSSVVMGREFRLFGAGVAVLVSSFFDISQKATQSGGVPFDIVWGRDQEQ